MEEQPVKIKLVIVGDSNIGKTSILWRFNNTDSLETVPTILDVFYTTVKVSGQPINLSLWDTTGQEVYNRLRPLSYPQTDIFIIAFSVIEPNSFDNALKVWLPELEENAKNIPKIFVGNKIDLRDDTKSNTANQNRPISYQTAQKIMFDMGYQYFECSALTQQGIQNIFQQAIRIALNNKDPHARKKKKPCILI